VSPLPASADPALSDALRVADNRPVLVRGGTVITGDASLGVLDPGDVLIQGTDIVKVAPRIDAPADALVIDAAGLIVSPGLVDVHRHTWETITRGIGGDWSLLDYFSWIIRAFGPEFTPDDVYAANLLASVEHVDAGITSLGDWSEQGTSPAHHDAAFRGLTDSGIRGRFQYANVYSSPQIWAFEPRMREMWEQYGDLSNRVSMQLALDYSRAPGEFPEEPAYQLAKDLGIPVITHAALFGWDHENWIGKLARNGFALPTTTYLHVVAASDEFLKVIADTGGSVGVGAYSNMNSGQGYPIIGRLHRMGVNLGLTTDTDVRWRQDIFDSMRAALSVDRMADHLEAHREGHLQSYNQLRAEDAFTYGTSGGATALGLDTVTGTLTPGKRADLIIVKPEPSAMPVSLNPTAHLVYQGRRDLVDSVIVDGRVLKHAGTHLVNDLDAVHKRAADARDGLIERIGVDKIRTAMTTSFLDHDAPMPAAFS
jgi:cytosine/adenosine deaminase-related metal-dependent hydrolase